MKVHPLQAQAVVKAYYRELRHTRPHTLPHTTEFINDATKAMHVALKALEDRNPCGEVFLPTSNTTNIGDMTPEVLVVALHYARSTTDFVPRNDAERAAIEKLLKAGLLEAQAPIHDRFRGWVEGGNGPRINSFYKATEGLRVYVEALSRIPLPRKETKWVIPV